jgi:8-oxo-dGTP pyrophosphatase MutT (NUDIX family)
MPLERTLTVRVRLILHSADHILLAHHKPTNTNFMPGGGLEHGESAISCLRREIAEECDLTLPDKLTPFGILENRFTEDSRDIHELLVHFSAVLDDLTPKPVNSRETDLEFRWVQLARLSEVEIWPHETYAAIHASKSGSPGFHYAPI